MLDIGYPPPPAVLLRSPLCLPTQDGAAGKTKQRGDAGAGLILAKNENRVSSIENQESSIEIYAASTINKSFFALL